MSQSLFSIKVDGSNDAGLEKMFPICFRIFDVNFNRIMTKLFDMNMLEGRDASTAEHMFTSIENQLCKNELSCDMVTMPKQILDIIILLSLAHLKEIQKS